MSNSPTLGNLNSYVDEDINDANVTAFHDTLEEQLENAGEDDDGRSEERRVGKECRL